MYFETIKKIKKFTCSCNKSNNPQCGHDQYFMKTDVELVSDTYKFHNAVQCAMVIC